MCKENFGQIVASSNVEKLEQIFDNCGDLLTELISTLESCKDKNDETKKEFLDELISNCIEVAELILRDSKYRKEVENSPKILADFLGLFERVSKEFS